MDDPMAMTNSELLRTPLYSKHIALGGKMVDFSGFELPIQYTSIMKEHQAVRNSCGLFDVSHLGEIRVQGSRAYEFINSLVPTKIQDLKDGFIRYTLMLNEDGGILDDILIYRESQNDFYLVINAGNIQKINTHIEAHKPVSGVEVLNESDDCGCIAIQGPGALAVCEAAFGKHFANMAYYSFKTLPETEEPVWISRSGYTGEDGFEFFAAGETLLEVWDHLIEIGQPLGMVPAGLGCRNTLRLEVGNSLYGHEMDETVTPYESRLSWLIDLEKEFIGKHSLIKHKAKGIQKRLCGFVMRDKAIGRDGYEVWSGNSKIGHVTSGSYSPSLKKNLGLACVDKDFARIGTLFDIEIHGKRYGAEVVKLPFVPIRHL